MNLAKYSLDNTKVIYFFLAVLLIGGVFSFGKLGKKEDAPFVIKSAVIMTRLLADHGFRLREEIYVLLFYIHRYSPTSFLIQSYPFSSSSKASSGPAVFTIRPL